MFFTSAGRVGAAEKAAEILKETPGPADRRHVLPADGFRKIPSKTRRSSAWSATPASTFFSWAWAPPKQEEKWVYRHRAEYNAGISIGIGVTFEGIAGMVKRAPLCGCSARASNGRGGFTWSPSAFGRPTSSITCSSSGSPQGKIPPRGVSLPARPGKGTGRGLKIPNSRHTSSCVSPSHPHRNRQPHSATIMTMDRHGHATITLPSGRYDVAAPANDGLPRLASLT